MIISNNTTTTIVKNFVTVEHNEKSYLVRLNKSEKVVYIAERIKDNSSYYGCRLEQLPTNSIKAVFGVTKREFLEKAQQFTTDVERIEEILESNCNDCSNCKVKKWCTNDDFDIDAAIDDKEEIFNIQ